MQSINLGAVLFGLLLLLWLTYALPRTASRRDVMGRARAAENAEMTPQARDLSAAVHARRSPTEVNPPMSQDRLLLRPADPTRRPRFDAVPGTRIDHLEDRARSRRLLRGVLTVLLVATGILIGLAIAQVIPAWTPLIGGAGLAVYVLGLRRAELERRARLARAAARTRQGGAETETARPGESAPQRAVLAGSVPAPIAVPAPSAPVEGAAERAGTPEPAARPGEWTPRPVPRPTYALRGEVEDLATRHAAHRRSMLATSMPLESERVEELEAIHETFAPAQDLDLDEVLARRRA
ncbi:hypothetical protein [Brachybacterium sp. UNK5269]|uniref:hypothetical protein n=1 Tax=Brachybacterium sp. UNK5269 TaxID=3408576 RepID=UPI003BAEDDDD